MIVTSRRDRNSGDAKVAGTSRSPLLRLPMRSEFFRPSKNQELLAPAAPDCAWFKSIEQDLRRRARLEAQCLAEFNQPAALSTYQRGKSVRTTRATAIDAGTFTPTGATEPLDWDWRTFELERDSAKESGALQPRVLTIDHRVYPQAPIERDSR